jgi:hypothetical protein
MIQPYQFQNQYFLPMEKFKIGTAELLLIDSLGL